MRLPRGQNRNEEPRAKKVEIVIKKQGIEPRPVKEIVIEQPKVDLL